MTQTVSRTYTILGSEFDVDQLKDVVNHGMSSGVPGFTYYSDTIAKFNEFEDDIETYLSDWYHDNMGEDNYINAITGVHDRIYSIDALKNTMVWIYVELVAFEILSENGYEF